MNDLSAQGTPEERDFARFLEHLDVSHISVWRAAGMLNRMGLNVTVNAMGRASTRAECKSYVDAGDLCIQQRVEVKGLSLDFTGRKDFPFPKCMVNECYKDDRAIPKPYAYVLTNRARTHAAVVMCEATRRYWLRETHIDKRYENAKPSEFYMCPVEHISFHPL